MRQRAVGVAEAKKSLSDLLNRVAYRGESIVIRKRGKPLARLVPITDERRAALADVRGWLADDDPFFTGLDAILAARHAGRPRLSGGRRRGR